MLGTIAFINDKTGFFSIKTKDGYYTVCETRDFNLLELGHSIEFDNVFNCTYFYNVDLGERIAAKVVDIGYTYQQVERFYK